MHSHFYCIDSAAAQIRIKEMWGKFVKMAFFLINLSCFKETLT